MTVTVSLDAPTARVIFSRLCLIDREDDILLHKFLEAGHVYFNVVGAHGKIFNAVRSVACSCSHAGEGGIYVGCSY